ncbi:hypothetical protein Tco_1068765 [Tanacetum coccineum]|uniref:Uncharacterized protein n=1 Tax=Tanacetum coccineum TaxID=301880 RepID=A0ABQ5HGM5_9ASTR
MTSLGMKYNRLKVIPGDIGITPTLLAPEHALSLTSGRKRKAQELEPEVLMRWHLEEIHMTWAHFRKKRTTLQLYTKVEEEKATQRLETASQFLATASGRSSNDVKNLATASRLN